MISWNQFWWSWLPILKRFFHFENQNGFQFLLCVEPKLEGAFTTNVKSVLSENLGGILGGTYPMLNEWVIVLVLSECFT